MKIPFMKLRARAKNQKPSRIYSIEFKRAILSSLVANSILAVLFIILGGVILHFYQGKTLPFLIKEIETQITYMRNIYNETPATKDGLKAGLGRLERIADGDYIMMKPYEHARLVQLASEHANLTRIESDRSHIFFKATVDNELIIFKLERQVDENIDPRDIKAEMLKDIESLDAAFQAVKDRPFTGSIRNNFRLDSQLPTITSF